MSSTQAEKKKSKFPYSSSLSFMLQILAIKPILGCSLRLIWLWKTFLMHKKNYKRRVN